MSAPWLYRAVWGSGLAIASPYLLGRAIAHGREMRERRGEWEPFPPAAANAVWVHAASVGEARAARALVRAFAERGLPVVFSLVTPAARALEEEWTVAGARVVRHAPLDFAPFVRRALETAKPRALVFLETEIWPELLFQASRRAIPPYFLSARLTPAGGARLGRVRALLGSALSHARVGAQSEGDALRWRALGIPDAQVRVTGNVKYEHPRGPLDSAARDRGRAGWERVVVFGSVRSREIDAIDQAVEICRAHDRPALFVVAPRHPARTAARLRNALSARLRLHERTSKEGPLLPVPPRDGQRHAALLVSTVGELRDYYALADVAFVGGTLCEVGGHNLFEAAEHATPVLFGPQTRHVDDVAAALIASAGGRKVADGAELGRAILAWLADESARAQAAQAAWQCARELSGALARTLAALEDWGFPFGVARESAGLSESANRRGKA
ncbi:MAG: hypothetical protein KA123_00180 [Candidatus Eisenbacteria bacterium]|nr:hypothetical protein [Candidatus Eisenbacteria bacterium]